MIDPMSHGVQAVAMLTAGIGLGIVAAFPHHRFTRFFFTFTWYRWLPTDPVKHQLGLLIDRVGLAAVGAILVGVALLSHS